MKNLDENSSYSLDLTRGELYWLAGSFGVSKLPLPDEAWRDRSAKNYESELQEGNASLQARGLLRAAGGVGWQVDRLPSAIIQWLSSASSLLRVEHFQRNGTVRRAHLFTSGEQGLSVEIDPTAAQFTLYETPAVLTEALLNWLALPAASKKAQPTYQLPQPESFLTAAWKNPKLVPQMLKAADISAKKTDIPAWVESLEFVTVLNAVQLDGRRNKITDQFAVCGDSKRVWGGGVDDEKVAMAPIQNKQLIADINKFLGVVRRHAQ